MLKGGQNFLKDQLLGREVEVEFHSLYLNQPLFAEIDTFVREKCGLDLQDLKKYYWKYPEGINYGSAKGKLIFGEALYFRSPENVLKLCKELDLTEAKNKILKAILMGCVYGFLDYSLSLVQIAYDSTIFGDKGQLAQLEKVIKVFGTGFRYTGRFSPKLSEGFRLLHRMFQPMQNGWASMEQTLGSRKRFKTFY